MDDFEAEFSWPNGDASSVILTGSFDHWSRSIRLPKSASGFTQRIRVPWNEKVPYKFIVDGRWVTRDDRPTEFDGVGNLNNVLFTPSKPAPPSTMDHQLTPAVPIESMPEATTLPEASLLCSETSHQEASKVDEGRGITESDSTDDTSAVVDLGVPCKELSPVDVPELTVEAAETADPRSEADSLSAILDSAMSTISKVEEITTSAAPDVCKEIASAQECISTDVSITPSISSDPADNILDGTEQPSVTSDIQSTVTDLPDIVQKVLSPEIAGAAPQIAPIVHLAILPVNDHTLNESASPSLEGSVAHSSDAATSVLGLSTHSPMNLSKAASPAMQETQAGEQNVLNPNPELTQEETSEAQVVEQDNANLLVDTPSEPATNSSTPKMDVSPNPVENTDTSAVDAGPVMSQTEPSSLAAEPKSASTVAASSAPSTPVLTSDTKLKDVSFPSSVTTAPPISPSSKLSATNTRKKRRSLFAKVKDFFSEKKKK